MRVRRWMLGSAKAPSEESRSLRSPTSRSASTAVSANNVPWHRNRAGSLTERQTGDNHGRDSGFENLASGSHVRLTKDSIPDWERRRRRVLSRRSVATVIFL